MKIGCSIYRGGELFPADRADYSSSKELGIICPFCRESLFLAKGEKQSPHWRHYAKSSNSPACEARALSKEGLEELRRFEAKARGQRLRLFNKRFWKIFSHGKVFPRDLKRACLGLPGIDGGQLKKLSRHCWERWDAAAIKASVPKQIQGMSGLEKAEALAHPALQGLRTEFADSVCEEFQGLEFSPLRLKILGEAIDWLGSRSAFDGGAFENLIQLSTLDCWEYFSPPIHSSQIAYMAISSLILTDWEEAIARS
jgi:hypothetical protein